MFMDLATTNAFLGIIAAVSVLEMLALITVVVAGFLAYRRLTEVIARIETQHVVPAMTRVNAVLDDVRGVTNVARNAVEGMDSSARRGITWVLRPFWHRRQVE
jgi:hypothetical protein